MKHKIQKIVSGGQTGADQAGLRVARKLGIATGGWAPRGWSTEAGPMPELEEFGLVEHSLSSYPARTRLNVQESHGTVWFGTPSSPGGRLTLGTCDREGKPSLLVSTSAPVSRQGGRIREFHDWLSRHDIRVLNVAGNRESTSQGIGQFTFAFLITALRQDDDHENAG